MSSLPAKYDRLAERFSERSYANLQFHARRQFTLATNWGPPVRPGDSVLELGCGDGYLAWLFVQHGLRYRGADISPRMVAESERRFRASGLQASFLVADVTRMPLEEPFDAVVSYMGTFFTYVSEPLVFLKRLRPYVRKKLILDLNPRRDMPVKEATVMLRDAGFRGVLWRPFFVPSERQLSVRVLQTLVLFEDMPVLRSLPLRWKFQCLLMAEP